MGGQVRSCGRTTRRENRVLTMVTIELDRYTVAYGGVTGVVTWLFGFGLTYLLAARDVRRTLEESLGDFLPASLVEDILQELPMRDISGWVFFQSHFVDTVIEAPLIGTVTRSFIGGETGFSPFLYLIPIGLLLAAGLAVGRLTGSTNVSDGIVAGVTVVPGYLLLSIAGALYFVVEIGQATVSPDLQTAIVVAGIIYPVLFAGVGGAIAGATARS